MSILYVMVIGFLVGLIARAIKPGDDRMGILMTTLFGIGGALIAKYVGQAMGWYAEGDLMAFVASLIGAMLLLTVYAMVHPKKKG